MDPAVNLYLSLFFIFYLYRHIFFDSHRFIQKLKDQIKSMERKLKQANDDVEAQKFTPHSVTGRKLMMKCRSLQVLYTYHKDKTKIANLD